MVFFCFISHVQGEPNRRYNYIKYSDGRIAGNSKSICHGRLRVKYRNDLLNRSQYNTIQYITNVYMNRRSRSIHLIESWATKIYHLFAFFCY